MAYRPYLPHAQYVQGDPTVRIAAQEIRFNSAALALLAEPTHLLLAWSAETRTLRITAVTSDTPGALALRRYRYTAALRAAGFLRFAGLDRWQAARGAGVVLPLQPLGGGGGEVVIPQE